MKEQWRINLHESTVINTDLRESYANDLGIRSGQYSPSSKGLVYKNAYWYNQDAQLVGIGDIRPNEPNQIADRLGSGELMTIVQSYNVGLSYHPSLIERLLEKKDNDPGKRFVARNFAMLIMPRCVYLKGIDDQSAVHPQLGKLPTLSPKSAHELMSVYAMASH